MNFEKPKTFEDAKRIAKILRQTNPAAASTYLLHFPRRREVEVAAYMVRMDGAST